MNNDIERPPSAGGSVLEFPENGSVEGQAAKWLAKLDGGNPSRDDLLAFEKWINEKEEHRKVFAETAAFWGELNILTKVVFPKVDSKKTQSSRIWRNWISAHGRLVSCLTLILVVISIFGWQSSMPAVEKYTTVIGEQKSIKLSDHSVVFLNTNSELVVEYSKNLRNIRLLKGEAHFDVFHDTSRPFRVFAGGGVIKAVGTAFSVHLYQSKVEVLVTEGAVELDESPSSNRPSNNLTPESSKDNNPNKEIVTPFSARRIKAGQLAKFDDHTLADIESLNVDKIEERLSWRQGKLVYKSIPLEKLVAEYSRYTSLNIVIPNQVDRERLVGGLFQIGDTAALFEALDIVFDIRAEMKSENTVYLVSKNNG